MTTDIKLKTRDVEGLQQRVKYIDRLKNDIEIGPFTSVTGVVTDSLSVGYSYQMMDPSYNLDVSGSLRVTEDARILSNLFVNKEAFVNGSTFFKNNVSVLGNTLLNTLNTTGNTSLLSLFVNESTLCNSNVSVMGVTSLNELNVTGGTSLESLVVNETAFYNSNISVLGVTSLNTLNVTGDTSLETLYVNGSTFLKHVIISEVSHMTNMSVDQFLNVGGNVSISGTTYIGGLLTLQNDLTSYSDRRIKKNITPLGKCLDTIADIHGYRFQRTDRKDDSYSIGLIAQELEETYPELVTEVKVGDERIKTVHYQAFTAVLLECIQELKEKITLLENKIFN